MARRRAAHRSEHAALKTGVFLAFSLALFTGMYFLYGKLDRVWRGVMEVRVLFAQVKKLEPIAPVRYDGMELGRVKSVKIVHATPKLLADLPPFKRDDLENLPLTENERTTLNLLPAEQIDAAARKAIEGRSMILATLTMLIEQDDKRLRADDLYYVSTSSLGVSTVEIVTGSGAVLPLRPGMLVLGVNADLISDIGRNMEQISELMRSVAKVIGGDAKREQIHEQLRNFDKITGLIESNATSVAKRLPDIWDGIDTRAVQSEKNMNDVIEKILGFKPKVESALKKTEASIASIRGGLTDSTNEVATYITDYRKQALEQVKAWRKVSAEYKKTLPDRMRDLKSTSVNALAAADKLDAMLDRVESQLKDSFQNARINSNAQSDAAMKTQETIWHFKNAPGSLNAKATAEQLKEKHADWRYEMVRKQYQELRRELAAMQNDLGVNDPADRERARHVEQILSESDAFFGVNRGDYIAVSTDAQSPATPANAGAPTEPVTPGKSTTPGTEIRTGEPVPVPPPAESVELPSRKPAPANGKE